MNEFFDSENSLIEIMVGSENSGQRLDVFCFKAMSENILSIKTIYVQDSEYKVFVKEETKIVFFDLEQLQNFGENEKGYYNQFIKNLFLLFVRLILQIPTEVTLVRRLSRMKP